MAFTIEYEGDGGEEILDLALDLCVKGQYIVELDVLTADTHTSKKGDYVVVERTGSDLLVNRYYEDEELGPEFVRRGESRSIPVHDVVGLKIY